MTRRVAIWLLSPAALLAGKADGERVRGRLAIEADGTPLLRVADGRVWRLEGDPESVAVLLDERVQAETFEAVGSLAGGHRFRIDPIHKKAMYVIRDGKALVITYWCEVCAIRTYSPGKCQCCQDETAFHPRDPILEQQAR